MHLFIHGSKAMFIYIYVGHICIDRNCAIDLYIDYIHLTSKLHICIYIHQCLCVMFLYSIDPCIHVLHIEAAKPE